MSDILIRGMEMPKGCSALTLKVWPDGQVEIIDTDGEWKTSEAIPVPPHGRCIDADALHEELYALEYARENEWLDGVREARGVDAARVALLDAPTIIPAEEGE